MRYSLNTTCLSSLVDTMITFQRIDAQDLCLCGNATLRTYGVRSCNNRSNTRTTRTYKHSTNCQKTKNLLHTFYLIPYPVYI